MNASPAKIHTFEIESNKLLGQLEQLIPSEEMFQAEPDRPTFRGDSSYLDSLIRTRMETYHIPGLVSYAVKDGEVIWNKSYGYAIISNSTDVADTTLLLLASISKTITVVALMQLWEQGLFDLDKGSLQIRDTCFFYTKGLLVRYRRIDLSEQRQPCAATQMPECSSQ